MKTSEIVSHLKDKIPQLTNLFGIDLDVTSMILQGGKTVRVITVQDHGLVVGSDFTISGARVKNVLTSLTQVDNIATAITTNPVGFVSPFLNETVTVLVSGATEIEFNGTQNVTERINQTTFTYNITGDPSSPATGSPILEEFLPLQYNGRNVVTTIINTTTFEFESPVNIADDATGTSIKLSKDIRIARVADAVSIIDFYTKQTSGDLWMFVVLNETLTSKSRQVSSDATDAWNTGSRRLGIIQTLDIFIAATATESLSGADIRDLMEDIHLILSKTLIGFRPDTVFSTGKENALIFLSHGLSRFDSQRYFHQFTFELFFSVFSSDTLQPDVIVPINRMELNLTDPKDVTKTILTAGKDF